jgi:hypothetical protein
MLETHFVGDELEKTGIVSFALLDVVQLCLDSGITDEFSTRLPIELDIYLQNVYEYLGDPIAPELSF